MINYIEKGPRIYGAFNIAFAPADVYISLVQIGLDRFAEELHQSTAHSFLHGVHRKWKAYTSMIQLRNPALSRITCRRNLSCNPSMVRLVRPIYQVWAVLNGYAYSEPYISQTNGVLCLCPLG